MPADYGLLNSGVKLNTPFENLSQVLQVRAQQENARGLAEQRQAIAEQRRAQTALTQQTADDIASTDAAYEGGGEFADIIARAPGHLRPIIAKQLNEASEFNTKAQTAKTAAEKAELDYGAHLASGVLYWQKDGPEALMNAAQTALAVAKKHGHDVSQLEAVIAQDPSKLQPMLESIIAQQRGPQAIGAQPTSVTPGQGVLNPATGKYEVPVPKEPTHSAALTEFKDAQDQGYKGTFEQYQTADANRKRSVTNISGMAGMYNQTDPKAIAEGIRRGEMPPDISQYGRPVQGAVASQLTIPGPNGERFNLADAQRTWASQKRLNSTMNGGQQVRIDQSIKSGLAMYDKVDELADQWKGQGFGPLSRLNLKAATEGAKGPEAAKLAIELQGQIAQLSSDVATLEQGGMTPTNEARAVAEKSLQAWWGNGTIKAMTAQGRANMKIRDLARTDQGAFVGGNTGGNVITGTGAPKPANAPAAAESLDHRVWRVGGKVGAEPK